MASKQCNDKWWRHATHSIYSLIADKYLTQLHFTGTINHQDVTDNDLQIKWEQEILKLMLNFMLLGKLRGMAVAPE